VLFSVWAFARASCTALLRAALFTGVLPALAAVASPAATVCPAKHMAASAAISGMYEEIRRIGRE
jgi:hypothetical protein